MNSKQIRLIEYYQRFKSLLNGNGTWNDQADLRIDYKDILPLYSADTLRRGVLLYKEFKENGLIKDVENSIDGTIELTNLPIEKISTSINKDNTITSEKILNLSNEALISKEQLLKAHGYNPDEFDLVSAKNSKWNVNTKEEGIKDLYSSKITVKPKEKEEKIDKNYIIKLMDDFTKNYVPGDIEKRILKDFVIKNTSINSKCAVLSLNDLHWGRYISSELNYGVEHTINSERNRIYNIMEKAVEKYKTMNIDKLIILLGSDFFNSDCYGFTTQHRNKQNNNMSFKDMFSTGLSLCVDLINKATELNVKIDVVFIPGNHGNNEDYMLGKCLEAYFRGIHGVNVSCSSEPREYIQYYNTLIGFTHGDKEKKNSLANLMAIEDNRWSNTEHHIWITGHNHQVKENIIEDNGVTVYTCPSLAFDDEWTREKGYSSKKRVMGFIIDKDNGVEEINYFYPDER